MNNHARRLFAAALSMAAAASLALPAGSASAAEPSAPTTLAVGEPATAGSVRARVKHWTPERMRAAFQRSPEQAQATSVAAAGPSVDTVGKVFFEHPDGTPDVCSGSAIDTPASTLVMTAGHCLYQGPGGGWMKNVVFVPGYENGDAPLGVFPAWNVTTDSLWSAEGDLEHDYGLIITHDNGAGEHVAEAAGGFGVVADQGAVNDVTIIGYPAEAPYDGEHQEECNDITEPTPPPQNMIYAYCPNMVGGSSGSPWLVEYDPGDQLGLIYGVNSVIDGGGYVATPRFDARTLSNVSLTDQIAAARP
ncbi:trypsin-like serine peptidase [Streptomyces sp. NPDC057271]|uniref:trypsin-like serine peptidase n=1 Tax=unclassified Streptomyces TaxID=2593676 RepID=UPI003627E2F4